MKSRSPIILAIIIILLVLGWMFSDDLLNRETKNSFNDNSSISNTTSENEANNIIVSAKRVKNNLISKTIRSNAVSYPEFEISLPSEVEGIISRLITKEGDLVSEGDKILEVDKGTLDQKITAAKAAFTASKKALDVAQKTLNGTLSEELQAARASLKLAQQDLDIVKKLFEQNFASSLEVTKKASVVENAQVKIATLENQQNYNLELNLIKSEADFQNAKTYLMDLNRELNNMIILSPANGIIEKLYLDKGERITKNSVVGNILGMENIKLISKISQNENEVSKNGNCSWMEVECLGACVSAPMIQINDDYYEDLDEKNTIEILDSLVRDKPLKPGSYRGRKNTAPEKKQPTNGENYA